METSTLLVETSCFSMVIVQSLTLFKPSSSVKKSKMPSYHLDNVNSDLENVVA